MFLFRAMICAVLAAVIVVPQSSGQTPEATGTILVKGLGVKGKDRGARPLARKRFYLFQGGLAENQPLIDKIKGLQVTSRDCFYVGLKASSCFIAWLKAENCETPFCRVIKRGDIAGVPEFESAYAKGLPLYGGKPDVALAWILNNMPAELVSGYYRHQKSVVDRVLTGSKPTQSAMSTSTAAEATFVGLSAGEKSTKYLVSNILPVEIDDKGYIWACEVDASRGKITTLPLSLDPKRKNCTLIVSELKACTSEICKKP